MIPQLPSPCPTCGYTFQRGAGGYRLCPACNVAQWALVEAFLVLSAEDLAAQYRREGDDACVLSTMLNDLGDAS
jgi:hypothetical protein